MKLLLRLLLLVPKKRSVDVTLGHPFILAVWIL